MPAELLAWPPVAASTCLVPTPPPVWLPTPRALAFAPRQTGLVLAALCDDGCVCVHEAEEVLAPRAWSLHSKVKVGRGSVGWDAWDMGWERVTRGARVGRRVGLGMEWNGISVKQGCRAG